MATKGTAYKPQPEQMHDVAEDDSQPDEHMAMRGMSSGAGAAAWKKTGYKIADQGENHHPGHAAGHTRGHVEPAAHLEHHSPTKQAPLGEGSRFKTIEAKGMKEGYGKEGAAALAASIGRKKYGAAKMAKMAAAGKKH